MNLNRNHVAECHDAIVSQDDHFVRMFAAAALEAMAHTQAGMFELQGKGGMPPVPTEQDVRNSAKAFMEDMLADFKMKLCEQIDLLNFKANFTLNASPEIED